MSEQEKINQYIADLDSQLFEVEKAIIDSDQVQAAALSVKRDELLRQRAVATGEKYEEPNRKHLTNGD